VSTRTTSISIASRAITWGWCNDAAFRAEADSQAEQALITELFERITLSDFEMMQSSAVCRPDGEWDVALTQAFHEH
jgi:hypothetical protein